MNKKDKYITPRAKIYGKVLVDLGFTLEQINDIERIFNISPVLSEVLLNPTVKVETKHRIVEQIFLKALSSQNAANLVNLLIDQNRLQLLSQILASATEILKSKKGIVTVRLYYVSLPTDSQLLRMENLLKAHLNCDQIHWEFIYDNSLIGGFRLDALGMSFDFSTRHRINQLKKRLLEVN